MKYLIAGLGNIGSEYKHTRHNIGFDVLDSLAKESDASFSDKRYAFVTEIKYKARAFVLIKPTTYVNRSGLAVNYWLKKEKIPLENCLVVYDEVALPFGALRIKPKGGSAGHNGIQNIIDVMGTSIFTRLRFGIGDDFYPGQKVNFVLGNWAGDEEKELPFLIDKCSEIIKSFGTIGLQHTMNQFNKK